MKKIVAESFQEYQQFSSSSSLNEEVINEGLSTDEINKVKELAKVEITTETINNNKKLIINVIKQFSPKTDAPQANKDAAIKAKNAVQTNPEKYPKTVKRFIDATVKSLDDPKATKLYSWDANNKQLNAFIMAKAKAAVGAEMGA